MTICLPRSRVEDLFLKNTLKHIIYGVLLTAVILYLTGFVLLRTPAAQTFIAHNIEKALSEKIGSDVHVGSVDVRLPNRVVVDDVEICDQKGKTMLRASRVSAAVNLLQLLDGNEQLDSIVTIATTNYPEKYSSFASRSKSSIMVMIFLLGSI